MSRRRGIYLVVEGIDGSGKSTLAQALAKRWRKGGCTVVLFQEPSRLPSGRRARMLAASDPWTAGLAFTEDRRRQRPLVTRALERYQIVLQDRSLYSTLAYQASALAGRPRSQLVELQRTAALRPDRVLYLDLPVRAALDRLSARGRRLESTEAGAALRRANRAYRRLAASPLWIRLDARQPVEALCRRVERRLGRWMTSRLCRRRARR